MTPVKNFIIKMRKSSSTSSSYSVSCTGVLLVCISVFLWLIVDTFVAIIPHTEMKIRQQKKNDKIQANPGDEFVHLWWMIQLTDIHISSYRNFHIPKNLESFLSEVIPTVKPFAVIATGDLTDAKLANVLQSKQELSEWQQYRRILNTYLSFNQHHQGETSPALSGESNADILKHDVTWIDMRGNHDKFDVVDSENGDENLYRKFSPFSNKWLPKSRHVVHKFSVNNTEYALVATDSTPDPGFRRPYNFFGVLPQSAVDAFRETDSDLAETQMTIWAGHYPASTIFVGGSVSAEQRLFDGRVIRNGAVYICGHLHTLYDAELALYGKHAPLGQLELELADFQRSQRFRLFAVDHGLFSFTDVSLHSWPIVLVTNPKQALFAMPNYEPLDKIGKSSHIRVLVFSNAPILYVQISLGSKFLGNATRKEKSHSLYTLPWNPAELNQNAFHTLQVKVVDEKSQSKSESVTFFVNEQLVSQLPANVGGPFAPLILLSNVPKIIRGAFLAGTLFCVILLMIARYHEYFLKLLSLPGFVAFAKLPSRLFFSFIFILTYPAFGPWHLGEVVTSRYAVTFAHGHLLIDDGTFQPDAVTSLYAFGNVVTFYMPLIFYFSWLFSPSSWYRWKIARIAQRLLFQFLILWQLWTSLADFQAYGILAFLFNPLRVWSSLALVYLDLKARKCISRY